jgi:peptidoglycan/LPS O-acetylase OafA/YrhL
MDRIKYLDGLRGLAIILVALYHAFVRWPDHVPYGDTYSNISIFEFGYLGVQLFFMISGYVILMTLERCTNTRVFLYKRWLRLFPAMLVCSILIFFSAPMFPERPNGAPQASSLLPGLLFVEPYLFEKFFGITLESLEGPFWSLYVEVKFYILSAIFYFLLGSNRMVVLLLSCFVLYSIINLFPSVHDIAVVKYSVPIIHFLDFQFYGWFAAGAAYYLYDKSNNITWLYAGLLISLLSVWQHGLGQIIVTLATSVIALLFFILQSYPKSRILFQNRILLFLGFISYPFYLMHENLLIALIVKLNLLMPFIPQLLLPFIPISVISLLAYIIASKLERPIKSVLMRTFSSLAQSFN